MADKSSLRGISVGIQSSLGTAASTPLDMTAFIARIHANAIPERVAQHCNHCGHTEQVELRHLVPRIGISGSGPRFLGFINDGRRGVRCSACQTWGDLSYAVPVAVQDQLVAAAQENGGRP